MKEPGGLALVLFHTRKVREALTAPAKWGTELFLVLLVLSVAGGMLTVGKQISTPFVQTAPIDLSIWALPKYTVLTLGRGILAYILSLAFTLIYGTIAAHNHRAEKLMLPALDVLQSIPVLGFMPGFLLATVALFPGKEIGLELACILGIFTGQAWNMTFSFHGSLRGIPQTMREAATVNRFSGWQTFKMLEVPAATIGLVWNSMMSMAGGWFFITTIESLQVGDQNFRLPGIGSYMKEASDEGNGRATIAAIIAMTLMIIFVDQVVWRPIIVWAQKYKIEETTEVDRPQSWVLHLLQHSRLYSWLVKKLEGRGPRIAARAAKTLRIAPREGGAEATPESQNAAKGSFHVVLRTGMAWLAIAAMVAMALWGAWRLAQNLMALPVAGTKDGHDWAHVLLALLVSFLRTSAAVLLGAAWALPVGIMIGRSPRWSQRLQPVVQVVASFPAPMFFTMVTAFLLFVRIPFSFGCVVLMLLGAQWYILFNVIAGASAIPADLKEVAAVNHMTRVQIWTRLYLPSVFPSFLTGMITAAGGAWNATIVSEYLDSGPGHQTFGLGSMITEATNAKDFPLLAASAVTMALFVVIINRLFWKRLYRFAEDRCSLNM